nr:immunoglobulin light chain junction region [Macaca mulatta]MOX79027.1 immunoglobulin light chain junction region [Macaca mulatta]MOX83468.1 immunoglobulin light chain junction region [Macaca mulatta]
DYHCLLYMGSGIRVF